MTDASGDEHSWAKQRLAEVTGAIDAHAIVAEWNPDGTIKSVNDHFCEMAQYSREELIGQSFELFSAGLIARDTIVQLRGSLRSGQVWRGEICLRVRDRSLVWMGATVVPVRDEAGVLQYSIGLWDDITELKRAEEAAHRLANYDTVTGLANRRGLIHLVMPEMLPARSGCTTSSALVVLSLDNFRQINDALGYDHADELLKTVSERLLVLHPGIAAVARTGAHEFCLVLDGLSEDFDRAEAEAKELVDSIRKSLRRADSVGQFGETSEFSAGIAVWRDTIDSPQRVLERAEIAMHRAKDLGVNQTRFFLPEAHAESIAELELLADLRLAPSRDELRVYFQPIVDIARIVVGYECLVRWQHPTRGLVMPDEFIPLADRTGLVHAIGQWVLRRACECIAAWSTQPDRAHLSLSVNVSARQFKDPEFSARVFAVLRETGADPQRLRFELTESMFHFDLEASVRKMEILRNAGIRFSLDDFGTGYSSLEYLSRLPVQQLKIDRSFVDRIGSGADDSAIVRLILGLAHSLGLHAVGEGVETESQYDFLRDHGCNAFQGYLFGKPVPLLGEAE